MKRTLLIAASALGLVALAAPAFAQSSATGTVGVNGFVTAKCFNAQTSGSSFGTANDIQLGELAGPNGQLATGLTPGHAPAGFQSATYSVTCTGTSNTIAMTVSPLTTAGTPPSGSTGTINFVADAELTLAAGGSDTHSASPGSPLAATPISGPIASSSNNLKITARDLTAVGGPLLMAGNYAGNIVVTIAPAS